jgi:hypothetical protein
MNRTCTFFLDDAELSGVMAHELAHVKHCDILTGTIAATFAGAIAMLGQFVRFGVGSQDRRNNNPLIRRWKNGSGACSFLPRKKIVCSEEQRGFIKVSAQGDPHEKLRDDGCGDRDCGMCLVHVATRRIRPGRGLDG